MADEKSYEDRRDSVVDDFNQEQEDIKARALAEREAAKPDEGETEEEYRARIAAVPGIFGDIDTTAGGAAAGTDVPSAQNELATVAAAEVEAEKQDGNEEAQELSNDEARRQTDVASGTAASAEEVDAGAEAQNEGQEGDVAQGQNQDEKAAEAAKVREVQAKEDGTAPKGRGRKS
jgi:hypothetical protein